MNIQPIEMDRQAADRAYREYLAIRAKTDEDLEIMKAYREVAKGTPIIYLSQALKDGGLNAQKLPHLAVARADYRFCYLYEIWRGGIGFESSNRRERGGGGRYCSPMRFPESTFPGIDLKGTYRALVPIVPGRFRPANLKGYHILWEAEWTRVAPKDPMLLKHIAGDMYAVLAIWDLTAIERAVLAKRFEGA